MALLGLPWVTGGGIREGTAGPEAAQRSRVGRDRSSQADCGTSAMITQDPAATVFGGQWEEGGELYWAFSRKRSGSCDRRLP